MSADVRPGGLRRSAAIASLVLVAAVALETLFRVVAAPLRVVAELILLVVFLAGAWFVLTRTGAKRALGAAVAVAAVVALLVVVIGGDDYLVVSVIIRIGALAVAVSLARYALSLSVTALTKSETPGIPVPAAARGVLFMNLKSGGGKAEQFHLVDECKRRGIEPVVRQWCGRARHGRW